MAVISGHGDTHDMGIFLGQRLDRLPGGIGRAVIDQHDFIAAFADFLVTDVRDAGVQVAETVGLVVAGRDNRKPEPWLIRLPFACSAFGVHVLSGQQSFPSRFDS